MLKKAALAGASLLCLVHQAEAQNFNQLLAFGDSTTDTGFFANASVGVPGNFAAENTYDRWIMNSLALGGSAHFTGPGPGNAQILGSFFGLSANPVNQPPGGGVGTNYAIGGAFNDATLGKGIENLFPTIPIPIIGGSLFGSPNENLPGTAQQIDNYLGSVNGHANPNALYLISSGGNNAFYASMTFGSDAEKANDFLLPEAQALANQVAKLQQAGARYIIVANEYQPPGADANLVKYGTTVFDATLTDLRAAGVKFIMADTASVIAAVEQNPLAFGITAPITSNACMFTGLSSLAASGVFCANTTTPSPANVTGEYGWLVTPDATRTHLFAGGTHLSEAGQIIIANYYDSLLTQQWNGTEIANRPVNGGAARLS